MNISLCSRLAVENIRKNYRFFIPRMLAEVGLLACFYIIFTLACDNRLASVKGGAYLPTFMWMGAVIIGLLSAILMLYTNSFLMKQRKREFGLYSVLGMEKKHICRVLFYESVFCMLFSIIAGLLFGILFYKFCSLVVCKLLKADIVVGFYFITPATILPAALIFIAIDGFAYLANCISIERMKPVELLESSHTGEKEPKVKWILLILGVLSLVCGYALSLTTKDPLDALLLFFVAVLLVIIGTYFLFVAGSIFILKSLKKNDGYYYRPGHISAVSGLLYRMKQNAVGLASVAILATGVLVMISTTFCLYSRTENVLEENFPQDFYMSAIVYDEEGKAVSVPEDVIGEIVREHAQKHGLEIRETCTQQYFEVTYSHEPGELIADQGIITNDAGFSSICNITFITEDLFVKLGGEPIGLKENQTAVCSFNAGVRFPDETFTLAQREYTKVKDLNYFPIKSALIGVNCFGMVVASDEIFFEIFEDQQLGYEFYASQLQNRYCVSFENREKTLETGNAFSADITEAIESYLASNGYDSFSIRQNDSYWETRESLYGMYGTLLFLGILLGLVCLFATVLIIYYKQISEGYEDAERYQIMRKIGMTDREVRDTIRSQIMLVFFLPLVTAGIHVAFAFPMLTKMMEVMLLDNAWLFAKWCVIVYAVFALVYTLIYKLTAKTYYKIVY